MSSLDCLICTEKKPFVSISCKHEICKSCFVKAGKTTCPFCRKEVIEDIDEETKDLTLFVKQLYDQNTKTEEERDIAYQEHDELVDENEIMLEELLKLKRRILLSTNRNFLNRTRKIIKAEFGMKY